MADEWHRADITYVTKLAGFRAYDRSSRELSLDPDPHKPIFIKTADGDTWSADAFVGFSLKESGTKIQDYAPPTLVMNVSETVEFPVNIDPPGTFHVVTDEGEVDISSVVVLVEFRQRQN